MRFMLFTILLTFLFACSPTNAEKQKSSSNAECKNFKNGNFYLIDKETGELITNIIRLDELQRETSVDGTSLETTVKWINDCTYELRVCKVISNPLNMPISQTETLLCAISEVSGDTCELTSGMKGGTDFFQFMMVRKR